MSLQINLRHLETKRLHFEGELEGEELELENLDEMIQTPEPLKYDLTVERLGRNILAQGRLEMRLECECVRCLERFEHEIIVDDWVCLIPLEGEDRVAVENDCVDLTPFIREDIVLAFPQHPLCDSECRGLAREPRREKVGETSQSGKGSSAWAELNKLKF
jgi:uncharacterized metal-binding protein YceD (DUF177 family)